MFTAARGDVKSTDLPSGVKPWTRSRPGCHVSRFGTPPAAGTTYTSRFPSISALYARSEPSGLKTGLVFNPNPEVIRCTPVPSSAHVQMSFP